jgi:hypothetical protein
MKKLFHVGVAMVFAVSLVTVASSGWTASPAESVEQAQATAAAKSARQGKQAETAGKAVAGKGAKRRQITGIVKAIDGNAGTLTVQGRRGSVSLKSGEKVKLDGIVVGDRVLTMYSGDTATSVRKIATGRAAADGKQR